MKRLIKYCYSLFLFVPLLSVIILLLTNYSGGKTHQIYHLPGSSPQNGYISLSSKDVLHDLYQPRANKFALLTTLQQSIRTTRVTRVKYLDTSLHLYEGLIKLVCNCINVLHNRLDKMYHKRITTWLPRRLFKS